MKTAILIEDGVCQLVLTPESKFEENAVKMLNERAASVKIFHGEFYDCEGGWNRQRRFTPMEGGHYDGRDSLIIRVEAVNTDGAVSPDDHGS